MELRPRCTCVMYQSQGTCYHTGYTPTFAQGAETIVSAPDSSPAVVSPTVANLRREAQRTDPATAKGRAARRAVAEAEDHDESLSTE